MLPQILYTLNLVFPFPNAPLSQGIERIHSIQPLLRNMHVHNVTRPVFTARDGVVGADIASRPDSPRRYLMRALTHNQTQSFLFCLTPNGHVLARLHLEVVPMGPEGHELRVQGQCYRNLHGLHRVMDSVIVNALRKPDDLADDEHAVEHARVLRYRRLVLSRVARP